MSAETTDAALKRERVLKKAKDSRRRRDRNPGAGP
jgi:hypothetical protein